MTATPWEVEPYDGWASPADARDVWPDAVEMDDTELEGYLQSAYEQCRAFATPLADGQTTIPRRVVDAQIMQARAIWRAVTAGDDNGIGPDGLTVTTFPMDRTVKNLLRPTPGRPVVG